MYHVVSVGKLSETQKSRLRNGHATRIKKGSGNKLHLTAEQIKKLESAHRNGRGYTLTMHPEQAEKHGCGFFGDIATKVKQLAIKHKNIINPLIKGAKATAHRGIAKLATSAHNKVDSFVQPVEGGAIKRRRGRPKKGAGLLGDVLGFINPTVGTVARTIGLGVKSKRRTKKTTTKKGNGLLGNIADMASLKLVNRTIGKGTRPARVPRGNAYGAGLGQDLLKAGAKKLAPMIIDAAANAAKNTVSGMGAKKRRVGRPRKHGGALYPA